MTVDDRLNSTRAYCRTELVTVEHVPPTRRPTDDERYHARVEAVLAADPGVVPFGAIANGFKRFLAERREAAAARAARSFEAGKAAKSSLDTVRRLSTLAFGN